MFNTSSLFASLFWSSVGMGYFIYGKRQQSISAMGGGILMTAVSYVIGSALVMSSLSLGVMAGVYFLIKRGN